MDPLTLRVAARYAVAAVISPEYIQKILHKLDQSNAPGAYDRLERLERSLRFHQVEPFPVTELPEYLRGRGVPDDEIDMVRQVKVPVPRVLKTVTYLDAIAQFEHEARVSAVIDMSFTDNPEAAKAVLGWLGGFKKLKAPARRVWDHAVRKVHFSRPRGTEDASWGLRGEIRLSVHHALDPESGRHKLTHELGHAFEEIHNINGFTPPWGSPPFVSDYAEFKPNVEDVAESFRAYVNEPTELRTKCPEKYDAIKALL
jgi:hypothetical protein